MDDEAVQIIKLDLINRLYVWFMNQSCSLCDCSCSQCHKTRIFRNDLIQVIGSSPSLDSLQSLLIDRVSEEGNHFDGDLMQWILMNT